MSVAYTMVQFHHCGVVYGMQADKGPHIAINNTSAGVRSTI